MYEDLSSGKESFKSLFWIKDRDILSEEEHMEHILPTQNALIQHANRVAYQVGL